MNVKLMKINNFIIYLAGILILFVNQGMAAENPASPPFSLAVRNNSLSLKGNGAFLGEILKELGRQADIKVYVSDSAAKEKVSLSFNDFPLIRGLKLILRGENYVLTYKEQNQQLTSRVAEIRVLPIAESAVTPPTSTSPRIALPGAPR
jgi:hypothetical protein